MKLFIPLVLLAISLGTANGLAKMFAKRCKVEKRLRELTDEEINAVWRKHKAKYTFEDCDEDTCPPTMSVKGLMKEECCRNFIMNLQVSHVRLGNEYKPIPYPSDDVSYFDAILPTMLQDVDKPPPKSWANRSKFEQNIRAQDWRDVREGLKAYGQFNERICFDKCPKHIPVEQLIQENSCCKEVILFWNLSHTLSKTTERDKPMPYQSSNPAQFQDMYKKFGLDFTP